MNTWVETLKQGGIALLVLEIVWWVVIATFILSRRKKKLKKIK